MIRPLLSLIACAPLFAQPAAPAPESFEDRRAEILAGLRGWYMDDSDTVAKPEISFSTTQEAAHAAETASLRALDAQARFLRNGRCATRDDWQSYSDMAVLVARRLGVTPPESAIPLYRGRLRPPENSLTPAEEAVRAELEASQKATGIAKRYLFISELIASPEPLPPSDKPRVVYVRGKTGKRIKKIVHPPALAPPPGPVSVIAQVNWEKADELAEVADDNAHGWDRKPKESLRRYRRRLRQLRAHCYEWVRRDMAALGIWDAALFRGYVPPTRRDRKRPIRAASFALAMAKVEAAAPLAARTSLRQLNLRVDPLVRGAIIVFSQSVCGYSPRNGHIEIITSVEPLQAASYKFHPVKTECLVKAANENKLHVYVPLRQPSAPSEAGR